MNMQLNYMNLYYYNCTGVCLSAHINDADDGGILHNASLTFDIILHASLNPIVIGGGVIVSIVLFVLCVKCYIFSVCACILRVLYA